MSDLKSRIDTLRRQYAHELAWKCPACKGPDIRARGVITLGLDDELKRCAECGEPVGDDGRTLVLPGVELLVLRIAPTTSEAKHLE